MPSFLSRIRHRGPHARPSTTTQSEPPPPAPAPSDTVPNLEAPADVSPPPLIGLQIRPDLNSLLESYETEDLSPNHQSKRVPVPVPPSPTHGVYGPLPPKPYTPRNVSTKSPEQTFPVASISTGQPAFPIFAKTSPLSGTFGRQEFPLTKLASIGLPNHEASARSRSFDDATNTNQTLTSAQRTGRNVTPTNQLPLSGTFEVSSSVRSLPDRRRRIDRRKGGKTRSLDSLRATRSSSKHRPHQTSTSVVHHHRPESPMTFGYPTPPYSTRTFGHHESPPPPLPPLDHPELTLDARGSGSISLGRSHKPSNSTSTIPHVNNIFGIPQELASGSSTSGKSVVRKKSKTLSVDSRRSSRRSSAEWSAVQATEGILTHSNNWQAQVSREILRLSFGDPAPIPGTGDPGSSRDAPHVAATQLPPAKTVVSPRPPPSLGSPLFLQGRPNPSHFCAYSVTDHIFALSRFQSCLSFFRILRRR